MSLGKPLAYLRDLPRGFFRTKVHRRANSDCAHVIRIFHPTTKYLVKLIRQCKQLVVIDLHDERDFVCVLSSYGSEHTKSRSNSVAAAFNSQLHDVLRIEIERIGSERS